MLTLSHSVLSLCELSKKIEAQPSSVKHLVLRDCRIVGDVPCRASLPGLGNIETFEVDCCTVGQLHALWLLVDDPLETWNDALKPLRDNIQSLIVHGDLAVACLAGELPLLRCVELVNGVLSVSGLKELLRTAPNLERVVLKEIMHDGPYGSPMRDLPISLELTLGILDSYALQVVRLIQAHVCPVECVTILPGSDAAVILTDPTQQAEQLTDWMTMGVPCRMCAVSDATERLAVITTFNPTEMELGKLAGLVQALCAMLPGATGLSLVCTDQESKHITADADQAVLRVIPPSICNVRRFDDAVSA